MSARWTRLAMMLLSATLVAALMSCGAHSIPKASHEVAGPEYAGAPCWVITGGACMQKDGKAKYVYAVGSAGGTRNAGLAREAALGRARTELARSLQVTVKSMLKDYQATTTGGAEFGTSAADEQHIEDVSKQITDLTLSGTEMNDMWVNRVGNTYVLARLDVEGFKNAVQRMGQLSESIRAAVVQRADKAFEDLDRSTGTPTR